MRKKWCSFRGRSVAGFRVSIDEPLTRRSFASACFPSSALDMPPPRRSRALRACMQFRCVLARSSSRACSAPRPCTDPRLRHLHLALAQRHMYYAPSPMPSPSHSLSPSHARMRSRPPSSSHAPSPSPSPSAQHAAHRMLAALFATRHSTRKRQCVLEKTNANAAIGTCHS